MEAYYLDKIKKEIAAALNSALGKKAVAGRDLAYPPDPELGELCLACFDRRVFGDDLASLPSAVSCLPFVADCTLAGRFLNLRLQPAVLAEAVLSEISGAGGNYGRARGKAPRRIMVEFSNANTHKQYHVGHVRNLCYGEAVSRLLAAGGNAVVPVSYINDFGIHAAKTIWALDRFYRGRETPKNKGAFLGEVYVRASSELEAGQAGKQEVEAIMKRIEDRRGADYEKWQETRQWTIDQFARIYGIMGVSFEHIYYESEYIDQGRRIVADLLSQGILRESQGAVIADLEEFALGVQVVRRSDGTATYIVADLALAREKFSRYQLDESIYITDNRQDLHFRQMFKLLELMGREEKFTHLKHEFVKLPGGLIASRTGNVITFEDLHQALLARAAAETAKRHPDWSQERVKAAAQALAVATIKFEMNKVSVDQIITFDINQALSFQGYTAAYLLYTTARLKGIFKKAGADEPPAAPSQAAKNLGSKDETGLLFKLARYPEALERAGVQYDPSEIAKYLFGLAQAVNDYYHRSPVLKSDDPIKRSRLSMLAAAAQVLENGLELLGIKALGEM